MKKSIILGILPSFIFSILSLLFLFLWYNELPNTESIIAYSLDILATSFCFSIFIIFNKSFFTRKAPVINKELLYFITTKQCTIIIVIGLIIYIYAAYNFTMKISESGPVVAIAEFRETGENYGTLLLKRLIQLIFIVSLFSSQANRSKKILLFSIVILIAYCGYSRTDLAILVYFFLIYLAFLYDGKQKKVISLFFILTALAIFFAGGISIYQERQSDLYNAIGHVLEKIFVYRIYSIYLGDILQQEPVYISTYLFSFLGFIGERILIFVGIEDIRYVVDTGFVSKFHSIKNNNSANALYPWWAWFYLTFGLFGIVIKNIFSFYILWLVCKLRLPMTFLYLSYLLLYGQFQRHIFLTANDFYQILGLFIFDLLIFSFFRKRMVYDS